MGAQGQAQTADVKGNDTVNTRVVPIILVPGVMGTRLDITGAASDWDPDDKSEMSGWLSSSRRSCVKDVDFKTPASVMTDLDDLILSSPEPGSDIVARSRLKQIALANMNPKPAPRGERSLVIKFWRERGWGELVWSFYGTILMDLAEQLNPGGETRPVYAVGYDWRQSNQDSGTRLRARIRTILGKHPLAKKVILVTHSMGGLVTRAALRQGAEADILGVVHTVMPADGAVVAYSRMLTGSREEHGDTEGGLRSILGPDRIQYLLMQSVLRGPTELLPSDSYPEVFLRFGQGITNKFFSDLFAEYARQEPPGIVYKEGEVEGTRPFRNTVTAADVTNLRDRLREAGIFTRSIAGKFHPNTFLLFGDGNKTVTEVDFNKGTATQDGSGMANLVARPPSGDGTVPRAGARFDACTPIQRDSAKVEHAACFGVATFRASVLDRVRRLLTLP
jgi:pimeloyl-ACP methyl ester carboxylesterase